MENARMTGGAATPTPYAGRSEVKSDQDRHELRVAARKWGTHGMRREDAIATNSVKFQNDHVGASFRRVFHTWWRYAATMTWSLEIRSGGELCQVSPQLAAILSLPRMYQAPSRPQATTARCCPMSGPWSVWFLCAPSNLNFSSVLTRAS